MSTLTPGRMISPALRKMLFVQIQETPPQDPSLAYSLTVPRSWSEGSTKHALPLKLERLKSLGWPHQVHLQLSATRLNREIGAGDWLKYYALTLKRTLVTIEVKTAHLADGLLQFEQSNSLFIERATITIHGPWLICLSCLAQEGAYSALAETFGMVVTSFRLLNSPSPSTIEPRLAHHLPAGLQFNCPPSWQPHSVTEKTIALSNGEANQLRVTLLDKKVITQPEQVIEHLLDEFPEVSVQALQHQAPLPSPHAERFPEGRLMIYQGEQAGQAQELWLSRFEEDSHYVTVALLTPARQEQFYPWAVNKRAYGIVLESLV